MQRKSCTLYPLFFGSKPHLRASHGHKHRSSVWLDVFRMAPSARAMDSAWTTNVSAILATRGHSAVHLSATPHPMSVPSSEPCSVPSPLLCFCSPSAASRAIDLVPSVRRALPGSVLGTLALCCVLCLFALILVATVFITRRTGRGYSRYACPCRGALGLSRRVAHPSFNRRLDKMWLIDWNDLEIDQQIGAGANGAVHHGESFPPPSLLPLLFYRC